MHEGGRRRGCEGEEEKGIRASLIYSNSEKEEKRFSTNKELYLPMQQEGKKKRENQQKLAPGEFFYLARRTKSPFVRPGGKKRRDQNFELF